MSSQRGVVRGLHFQAPPHAQAKLVRVVRGAIFDVVVDIRISSTTFGRHVAVTLSADNWLQLYVPVGMAHGFMTLTENTEVVYKTSDEYAPHAEGGLNWLDEELAIQWPIEPQIAVLTERDRKLPKLSQICSPFD